jgi:hypothetical protein
LLFLEVDFQNDHFSWAKAKLVTANKVTESSLIFIKNWFF